MLAAVLLACAPGATRPETPPGAVVERRLAAMGTSLVVEVEAAERSAALRASERAVLAIEAAERRLSTWTDAGELARLNAAPPGARFDLSPELARELARARELHDLTGGAFDPSVGGLVRAWDLRGAGRVPSPAELEAARLPEGLAALELGLDERGPFARRARGELVLEEGAFGKGAGLDDALAALRAAGAQAAYLDLGGQIAVLGRPRRVAVAHPGERERALFAFELAAGSVATSGNSERAATASGERIGHLLDPRTGRPAANFGSVTVTAPDGFTADALSTACFVLGPERALALGASLPDVEVLVLELVGAEVRATATPALARRLEPLEPLEIRVADSVYQREGTALLTPAPKREEGR